MAGEQLAVLALLVLAFAAGWYANGRGPRRGDEPGGHRMALLDRGTDSAGRVAAAAGAALAALGPDGAGRAGALADLSHELAELSELADRVRDDFGTQSPLAIDLGQAVEAAAMIEREIGSGSPAEPFGDDRARMLDTYAAVLRDARIRYVRGVDAARSVDAASLRPGRPDR